MARIGDDLLTLSGGRFRVGEWTVCPSEGLLVGAGEVRRIEPRVMDLLCHLAANAGRLVSKEEALTEVWGSRTVVDAVLPQAVHTLRHALGDDSRSPRYILTLHRRGYKLIAEVAALEVAPAAATASAERRPANARRWSLLVALLVALAAGLVVRLALYGSPQAPRPIDSVAIMELEPSGDEKAGDLAEGITATLVEELQGLQALLVIPPSATQRYEGSGRTLSEIAAALGVAAVLDGRVQEMSDRVIVTVNLVAAGTGEQPFWSTHLECSHHGLAQMQAELARTLAGAMRVALRPEEAGRLARQPRIRAEDYPRYLEVLRSMKHRSPEQLRLAIGQLVEITGNNPRYAPAFATLAEAEMAASHFGVVTSATAARDAAEAALAALDADPQLAAAYVALMRVKIEYQWDWLGAGWCFDRAVALSPGIASIWRQHAWWLALAGRTGEAVESMRKAARLEPGFEKIGVEVAYMLHFDGRNDEAIQTATALLAENPGDATAWVILGRARLAKGDLEGALEALAQPAKLGRSAPMVLAAWVHANAVAGRRKEALAALPQLEEAVARRRAGCDLLALAHLGLGDTGKALDLLDTALVERPATLVQVAIDPRFAPLRFAPRFQLLLRAMGMRPWPLPSLRPSLTIRASTSGAPTTLRDPRPAPLLP